MKTILQASKEIGVSRQYLYSLIKDGKIKAEKTKEGKLMIPDDYIDFMEKVEEPEKILINARQAGELLGKTTHQIYAMAKRGKLQHYMVGKLFRFDKKYIESVAKNGH